MTRKVFFILLCFQLWSMTSCCDENYRITGTGAIQAYEELFSDVPISDVAGTFVLVVQIERTQVSNSLENPFLTQTYASIDCFETYVNSVDLASVIVSTNKAFDFNGNRVAPGADITSFAGIEVREDFDLVIDFTEPFIQAADFGEEVYQFNISFSTSDGDSYSSTIDLNMAI